jgi:hypothetical protein
VGLSGKKQTSTGTTTSSGTSTTTPTDPFGYIARAGEFKPRIDPSIGYRLGEKERQLEDSMVSPTGGYVTPQIRDAILRSGRRELMQEAGAQTRAGAYDVNRQQGAQNLALAGLTRGQTETGTSTSTSTGTVRQSQSPWGTIAGIGAGLAPISL